MSTLTAACQLHRSRALPRAFVILIDGSRKGGVRVASCLVTDLLSQTAFVDELANRGSVRIPHVVPIDRLASRQTLRRKVRAALSDLQAPDRLTAPLKSGRDDDGGRLVSPNPTADAPRRQWMPYAD